MGYFFLSFYQKMYLLLIQKKRKWRTKKIRMWLDFVKRFSNAQRKSFGTISQYSKGISTCFASGHFAMCFSDENDQVAIAFGNQFIRKKIYEGYGHYSPWILQTTTVTFFPFFAIHWYSYLEMWHTKIPFFGSIPETDTSFISAH